MPCPGDPGPRPGFIPAPDCARAVMNYTVFDQQIANVFYFKRPGPWDLGSLQEQAEEMRSAWNVRLSPLLSAAVVLLDITITNVAVEDDEKYVLPCNDVGTYSSAAFETTGNTFCIKFNTHRVGRSYRGRMYWPLLNANAVNDGKIASSGIADSMIGALALFFADVAGVTGNDHVVVSYQNGCEWRTTAEATQVLTYTYTDLNLDSQRRRLPGRGT